MFTEFTKYHSIENHDKHLHIEKVASCRILSDDPFVVQEKLHGANFSFWWRADTPHQLQMASRNRFLKTGDEEDFYRGWTFLCQRINNAIVECCRAVYSKHSSSSETASTVVIFGELFGGDYAHPDVTPSWNGRPIQKEVQYGPDIMFGAFDIKVGRKFLDVEEAIATFKQHNVFHTPILFKGTLEECLEFDTNFRSTVPKLLGLPEIEAPNIVEGIVIKSLTAGNRRRLVIKKKNEAFREVTRTRKVKIDKKLSLQLKELVPEATLVALAQAVTKNRLSNVLSKLGQPITVKTRRRIEGMFVSDVFGDVMTKDDRRAFDKPVKLRLHTFIVNELRPIIEQVIKEQAEHEIAK